MSGGGGSTNTVEKADPWPQQQPYLTYGYGQAKNNYQNLAPQYYPNRTYTPFSTQTEQALDMAQNRAIQGSPVEQAMQNQVQGTLQGDYLNSNPYLDQMYNTAAQRVTETFNDQVMPGINASFGAAGGQGSKIHQELATDAAGELSQTLGQMSANIYGNNYQQERARQMQAAGMAPMAGNLDWQNIGKLGTVGSAIEGKAGQVLQDDMARWNHYQNLPAQMLQNYNANIQGNVGAATTSRMDADSNPWAGALGGAGLGYMVGGGIGSALGAGASTAALTPVTAAMGTGGGAAAGAAQGSWAGPIGALVGAGLGYFATK